MEGSGCINESSGLGSAYECELGSTAQNETKFEVTAPQHDYLLAFLLVQLTGSTTITVAAVVVIGTIVYQKLLSKSHYSFVVNLMICDIVTALQFSLLHSFLYLHNWFAAAKATVSCYLQVFFYIAPVTSGFMVVNLTIDAALAMTYPLKYKQLMTKTKVFALSVLAWVLAACLTLPALASSLLDTEVEDLNLCPQVVTPYLPLLVGRFATAILIIVMSTYLYWSAYKAKRKIRYLVGRGDSAQSLVVKLKKNTRLSITLLLIVTVDCILRIGRPAASITASYIGIFETPVFVVILAGMSWLEFINHPVVYGLMLHEVYRSLCCKNGNNVTTV